jgi:hypothetical protein
MPFFIHRQSPHPHQACRSLLQKAVRRGDVALTRRTADHLGEVGDTSWLRQRTGVIVLEECWPLAADLDWSPGTRPLTRALARAAQAVKAKDATGLGSLAYARTKGDTSVLTGAATDCHVARLAEAIQEPATFWDWAQREAPSGRARTVVEAARQAHRRGGWPWDKAFIQAAAYLAVTDRVPEVQDAVPTATAFPFWVALDRHTPQGKVVLRTVAKQEGLPFRHLLWTSFYFEGAQLNQAAPSIWWELDVAWRLRKVGLDVEQGRAIWEHARPIVAAALRTQADELRAHVFASAQASTEHEIPD